MTKPEQPSRSHLPVSGTVLMLLCALTIVVLPTAQAQTFSVLHNFSSGPDGATPYTGLTVDKAGNFYGTTFSVAPAISAPFTG